MPFPTSIDLEFRLRDATLLLLDGINDWITMGDRLDRSSSFTLEAWVMPVTITPLSNASIISKDTGSSGWGLQMLRGGELRFFCRQWSTVNHDSGSDNLLVKNHWNHVAGVFNNSANTVTVYINAVEVLRSTGVNGSPSGNSTALSIGGTASGSHFPGYIRNVALFSDARSAAEILGSFQATLTGNEGNLLGLWIIDEGLGTNINDDAGTAQNGTRSGGTWQTHKEAVYWTVKTADVQSVKGVRIDGGIRGLTPSNRLAGPGSMKFALDNSAGNSEASEGLYSPRHANALVGFDVGTRARLHIVNASTDYYEGYGKVGKISPRAGTKRARTVRVTVNDWITDLHRHKIDLLQVGASVRSDSLIRAVIDNMVEQPRAVDLGIGQETFPFALDDVSEGRTSGSGVIRRAIISEFGYGMIVGDSVAGGTFRFQGRHERLNDTVVVLTLAGGDVAFIKVEHDPALIFNKIDVKVFPRRVGTTPETLAVLDRPIEIEADLSETVKLNYRDPNVLDARLSGQNMQDAEGDNAITPGGFELSSEGWDANGNGVTISRSSFDGKVGRFSLELDSGTSSSVRPQAESRGSGSGSFSQSDVVHWQVYLRIPDAWQDQIQIAISQYDVNDVIGSTSVVAGNINTPADVWQRFAGQLTLTNSDVDHIRIFVRAESFGNYSGGAVQLYIDEVYLIEAAALNFKFSSSESGTGDKDDDLALIDSVIGGSAAEFELVNTSGALGYVTMLRARGDAVRSYNPLTQIAEDVDSQVGQGVRPITISLSYQDDPRIGDDFASNVLNKYKDPTGWIKEIRFHANRSSTLLAGAFNVHPGDRVRISESVTGINEDYFVNGKTLDIFNKEFIDCTLRVTPAGVEDFWRIGIVGSSEIGQTTIVGF